MRLLRTSLIVLAAGALGGAFVGIGESILVTLTAGGGDEHWLFLFGTLAYGAIGAGLGVGGAIVGGLLRGGLLRRGLLRGGLLRRRIDDGGLVGWAVAAAVGLPMLAVGRYHVVKRVFGEQLPATSTTGIVTYLLLFLGVAVVVFLAIVVVRRCLRTAGALGPVAVFAGLAALCLLIGIVTGEPQVETIDRRVAPAHLAGKPNVILIVADTLRADSIDWAGGQGFARLARDGVLFENAYAQASWTRPSIASILTGVYPSVHGAIQKMDFLPERVLTLAEAMRSEGYWTAGVTTNINVAPVFNFQQGFDEYRYLEPSFYFWATDSCTQLAVYKGLRVGRERFLASRMYFEHYYQDAAVVNRWLSGWLSQKPPEPFFLFIHYMDPHDPYFEIPYNGHGVARVTNPMPPAAEADDLFALYSHNIEYLDGYLETMVEMLQEGGLYDRSVVAFAADHGEEFYEHQGWWHGTTLYEEVLRVPLWLKRSPESLAGQRREDLARTIDIAPTLMAAAGLPIPEPFLGIDLFTGRVEEPILAEEDLEGNRLSSLRSGPWKIILANPGNPRGLAPTELFNLSTDPREERNLAETESRAVTDLLAKLDEMRRRIAAH